MHAHNRFSFSSKFGRTLFNEEDRIFHDKSTCFCLDSLSGFNVVIQRECGAFEDPIILPLEDSDDTPQVSSQVVEPLLPSRPLEFCLDQWGDLLFHLYLRSNRSSEFLTFQIVAINLEEIQSYCTLLTWARGKQSRITVSRACASTASWTREHLGASPSATCK